MLPTERLGGVPLVEIKNGEELKAWLLVLLRHKVLTARAFGDRRGAAWAS
jgi:hypothetical protein